MKSVIFYVDNVERYYFFRRLVPPLAAITLNAVFITNRLSVWIECMKSNIPCRLVLKGPQKCLPADIKHTREGRLQQLDLYEQAHLYGGISATIHKICENEDVVGIIVWNSATLMGQACRNAAHRLGIRCLFMEIANIEGRVVADPEGTNAAASITDKPDLMLFDLPEDEEFQRWRKRYRKAKFVTSIPPQARDAWLPNWRYGLDLVGFTILRIPRDTNESVAGKIRRRFRRRQRLRPRGSPHPPNGSFLFLPLQLTNDANLLVFSDVDNLRAILLARDIAQKRGLPLVVKIHPAEKDLDFVNTIEGMHEAGDIWLSSADTYTLIEQADEVITVNSTVGLEAMILGTPVTVLGRAIYQNFTFRHVKAYVLRYTLDFDYFGNRPISPSDAQSLIDRMRSSDTLLPSLRVLKRKKCPQDQS